MNRGEGEFSKNQGYGWRAGRLNVNFRCDAEVMWAKDGVADVVDRFRVVNLYSMTEPSPQALV